MDAAHRDVHRPEYCELELYADLEDLRGRFAERMTHADAVIVGSCVDAGAQVCDWVLNEAAGIRAFYDIDTPVTLQSLESDRCQYLQREQLGAFDLVLSFTGGPTLQYLQAKFGARCAQPLYCSVDSDAYAPRPRRKDIDLGYLGTYSADRQRALDALLLEPARRLPQRAFAVFGAQYPQGLQWPDNVRRTEHCPPSEHVAFYCRQRCTLNLTRAAMRQRGYSPSVRLFEAAACETAIMSDYWPGLREFFEPDEQIMIVESTGEVLERLESSSDCDLQRMARRAREHVLVAHTGVQRAAELESYLLDTVRAAAEPALPIQNALRAAGSTAVPARLP